MLRTSILKLIALLPGVALTLLLTAYSINGQTISPTSAQQQNEIAKASEATKRVEESLAPQPLFQGYRGVTLGLTAEEVRAKLDRLKEKGKIQDFFVFSDTEWAQIFYDKDGKVIAISVDYLGKASNPPTSREVLGEDLIAKADGSMYELKRYPDAGYWVSYNRTAGNDPTVTITMQKMD
jgi:hypothetical protein